MNLPLEIVDKILQYDGRIKYRKGEFVNVIHIRTLNFYRFILNPVLKKKQNILYNIDTANIGHIINLFSNPNPHFEPTRFYFEFEFDSLPGVGLCYDFYWGNNNFQIIYFDIRYGLTQLTTIIAHDFLIL